MPGNTCEITPKHPPTSLVIFLHGYGSNGANLIELGKYWEKALPNTLFIAPNAPERCPHTINGYQWYDLTNRAPEFLKRGLDAATPDLVSFIQGTQAHCNIAASKTVCVGFSQGTFMALNLLRETDLLCGGILGFSGGLTISPTHHHKTAIQLVHGEEDTVVPIELSIQAVQDLKKIGYDVCLDKIPKLDHSIDPTGLKIGQKFLVKTLI